MNKPTLMQRLALAYRAIKWGSKPFRDPVIASWFGSYDDDTGIQVDANTSMQISAVSAAVRLLAGTLGSLPLKVYKHSDAGKDQAVNHPLYDILHRRPNHFQTPYEFKEMIMGHCLLRGAFFGEIISTGGQGVAEIIPRHPDRVQPFWAPDGKKAFRYYPPDGAQRIILQDEMFHVMFFTTDGLSALDPITNHRRTLGLTIGAEKYGARFYKNDATPNFVFEFPGKLKDPQQFKEAWNKAHQGVDKSHEHAILEHGMKIHELSITPENAQFLETRKFQIADIARIFLVPPHMIGDLEKATYSNIEQQSLNYVIYTMAPWLVKIEQAITRDLFSDTDSKTHFAEFIVDALLRGDIKSRYEAYYKGRMGGWLSVNAILGMENMNHIENGDTHIVPLNMTLIENLRNQTPEEVRALQLILARTLFKDLPNAEAAQIIQEYGEHNA